MVTDAKDKISSRRTTRTSPGEQKLLTSGWLVWVGVVAQGPTAVKQTHPFRLADGAEASEHKKRAANA